MSGVWCLPAKTKWPGMFPAFPWIPHTLKFPNLWINRTYPHFWLKRNNSSYSWLMSFRICGAVWLMWRCTGSVPVFDKKGLINIKEAIPDQCFKTLDTDGNFLQHLKPPFCYCRHKWISGFYEAILPLICLIRNSFYSSEAFPELMIIVLDDLLISAALDILNENKNVFRVDNLKNQVYTDVKRK